MSDGKSVRLFLVDGTPGGLMTAEIINWTGSVVAANRSSLKELLARPEVAEQTGVYLLLGDNPEDGAELAYIGESDNVSGRLKQHAKPEQSAGRGGKDFWTRAVVLTSKDSNITKAHVRYLEARLIQLAQQAKRARLTNDTAPDQSSSLPESDRSDMEYYLEQAMIVLPVLGLDLFRSRQATLAATAKSEEGVAASPVFELVRSRIDGVKANAQEVDGEFIVFAGSTARSAWVGETKITYRTLREQLERDGIIVPSPNGQTAVFTQDYAFSSPSAAASVILCQSANGRHKWMLPGQNVDYGTWQSHGVEDGGVAA